MTDFRKQRFLIAFVFVVYVCWVNTVAWSQQAEPSGILEVIGRGKIYRDNVAKARDEAIEDGLSNAVEQAVGLLISSALVVGHFQLLGDRVYSQAEEFINDYKVLTESKSGQYYRVVVQATLATSALEDRLKDIGVLVVYKEMPSVMLLLSEQFVGEVSPRRSWERPAFGLSPLVVESGLSRYMGERGFVVITPPTGLTKGLQPGGEVEAVELSDDEAINLAKQEGAEVVIVGKAFAQLSGNILGTDIKSVEANVSARAIKVDDGLVIGSFDGTKAAVNSDEIAASEEALALTVSDLAEDLTRQIAANWGKVTSQSVLVELVVKGIKEYADFVRFRTTLRNEIRGVNNIYLRAIQAGEAKMDVDLKGNPRTLADELILKSFEGFGVNIFEVGEKQIKLELIPKRDVLDELQTLDEEEYQP